MQQKSFALSRLTVIALVLGLVACGETSGVHPGPLRIAPGGPGCNASFGPQSTACPELIASSETGLSEPRTVRNLQPGKFRRPRYCVGGNAALSAET